VQACQKNIYLPHSELRAQHHDFAATVAIDVGRGDLIIAADRPGRRGCAGGKLGIGRQKRARILRSAKEPRQLIEAGDRGPA
jgi:hypothetical protein